MSTETKTIGESLTGFSPAIYLSCGDLGYFSLPGAKQRLPEGEAALDEKRAIRSVGPYEYYTFTFESTEQTPRHAVYHFSRSVIAISEVKAVTFQVEDNIIRVWTFIARRDKMVRKAIYEKELCLMDSYPNMIFDFNVVSIRSLSEPFIPQNLHGFLSFYRNINGD